MKRYLAIFILCICSFIINVSAIEYKVGDYVEYKGIGFYVVSDNGDYLTLLKDEPLTVEEVNKYGKGHINQYPNSDKIGQAFDDEGYGGVAYSMTANCGYAETATSGYEFNSSDCITGYNGSDVKQVVDNWSKNELGNDNLITDDLGYKARLITIEELKNNLGFSSNLSTSDGSWYSDSENIPTWVAKYSYWTMSTIKLDYLDNYKFDSIWSVNKNGAIVDTTALSSTKLTAVGVNRFLLIRPVINLKTSLKLNKNKYQSYKIGDIVEYNGVKFYVIKNSDGNDKEVTLIKATPLTVDEVNKYGIVNGINYINKYTSEYVGTAKDVGGYGGIAYYSSEKCGYKDGKYSYDECKYDYESSDLKQIIDNWSKAILLKGDNNFTNKYKVNIINNGTLTHDLGYKITITGSPAISNLSSEDAPEFMKQLYDCWKTGGLKLTGYDSYKSITLNMWKVCPVVTLSKVKNSETINEETNKIETNKLNIPDTLLKNPIFIVIIGIILIVIATIIVSLVIKKKNKFHKEVD